MADHSEKADDVKSLDPTTYFVSFLKERVPERASLLDGLVQQYGIHFQLLHDLEMTRFRVVEETNCVQVGLKGVTRLMASAFAYVIADVETRCAMKAVLEGKVAPGNHISQKAGSELLIWALKNDIQSATSARDHDLLSLETYPNVAALIDISLPEGQKHHAIAVFANALTWLLLHELAHIHLKHRAFDKDNITPEESLVSIEQERAADATATEWLLGADGIRPRDLFERQFGLATALGWMTAQVIFLGKLSADRHPAAYDRLFQILNQHISDQHTDVWCFVQVILVLNFSASNHAVSTDLIGPPFKENASRMIDEIAIPRKAS